MRVCLIIDKEGIGNAGQSVTVEDATGLDWIAKSEARPADNCATPEAWDMAAQVEKNNAAKAALSKEEAKNGTIHPLHK